MRDDALGSLQRSVAEVLAAGLTGLDLLLIAAAVVITLGGIRTGLLARVAAWAGLVLGLLLSARTVPSVLSLADAAGLPARTFVAVLTLALTVSLTSTLLQVASAPLRKLLTLGPLSLLDRALGGVASLVMFALVAWLVLPTAAAVPGRVSSEVRSSAVLGVLDSATPAQPDIGRTVRTLLGGDRFPDVFASLAPTPEPSAPPEAVAIASEVIERATRATTGVRALGCGRAYSGSGFAIDDEHVVTNAHVVAGAREVDLLTNDRRSVSATVVVFDAQRDLALLHAPGHGLRPLDLAEATVGDVAAVIGYPGGQTEPRVAAVLIDRWVTGVGRDIYGRGPTERSLYFLAAELRSGDSGAPVIDVDGRAVGVVFAVSPDVRTVAYALTIVELRAVLDADRSPGDAGRCI